MKNRDKYPADWFDTIRPAILRRDNYKCQNCFVKHRGTYYIDDGNKYVEADDFVQEWAKREGYKLVKIHLQVAHLDQDTTNNDERNLKALCPRCHMKTDNAVNALKRLAKRSR